MSSRIEQIIEEIEEYVDSCKFQPLSTTKIVVNKEELEELLRELRLKTPDEIKRYQKIISNKDAILADAQSKADGIIASAEARAREMVSQHEVMQQAYAQANDTINKANQQAQQILDSATQDANNIRYSAITYTDDMLANLGNLLGTTIDDVGARYNALVQSLQSAYSTVKQNRQELAPQTGQGEYSDSDTDSSRDNNQYDLGDDDLGDIDDLDDIDDLYDLDDFDDDKRRPAK
jgi:cell division septum initiation protein DivIVA